MSVNPSKLSPVDFCIMVLWVYGLTTGQIYDHFARERGKSKAAVRGVINRIGSRRDTMSRDDRQKFLDMMKAARIDDGKLEDYFFKAKPLASDASAVYGPPARKPRKTAPQAPAPDLTTRKGRKLAKKLEQQRRAAELKRQDEEEERAAGGAPRGVGTYPLEHLRFCGLLQDKNENVKGSLSRTANESSRFVAGQLLRAMFDASLLTGIKSQQYEILGSSSNRGFSISFRVLQARQSLADLRMMLGPERFLVIERLLRNDEFIWRSVPASKADDVLEMIRCGLDCFSVYDLYMSPEDFETRWGFSPDVPRSRTKSEAMDISRTARSIIAQGQRRAS